MPGTIHPSKTLFLREAAGEVDRPDMGKFELTTMVSSGVPIVRCEKTGKYFTLSWEEIVDMAVEAGIARKDPTR